MMALCLNYLKRPRLKKPVLVAALPGIAHIGKLAVEFLIRELRAEKFAELYSEHFPEWVVREGGLVKTLKVDFYHCRPNGSKRDLILATADAQASSSKGQYELSNEILDFATDNGANTVITMAAYVISPDESRNRVVGVASDTKMAKLLAKHNIELLNNGMIVGMNGLLVAMAAVRDLEGFCLLGTTSGGILDAQATKAVLEALANILGFKLNVGNLDKFLPTLPKAKIDRMELPEPSAEEITYIR